MNAARVIAGVLISAAATAALGLGSRAPYSSPDADTSLLRLSWRLRGEKLQSCRDRTEAELAALPVHMRTPQVCTERLLSYHLRLSVDGVLVDTVTILPAGAKGDRPIFVLVERPLTPGPHTIELDFLPSEAGSGSPHKPLHYAGAVEARPGRINLITIAPDTRELILRQ